MVRCWLLLPLCDSVIVLCFVCPFSLMGKRELVALLSLSSWCLVIVVRLFLVVSWVGLQFVIVVFADHTFFLLLRHSGYNRNCLSKFHGITWNQTTDVHQWSTLITREITWRWRYIKWRWHHRNNVTTITGVIAAKQTVNNEVDVVSMKYR